jgi:hypothetical protein
VSLLSLTIHPTTSLSVSSIYFLSASVLTTISVLISPYRYQHLDQVRHCPNRCCSFQTVVRGPLRSPVLASVVARRLRRPLLLRKLTPKSKSVERKLAARQTNAKVDSALSLNLPPVVCWLVSLPDPARAVVLMVTCLGGRGVELLPACS